MKHLISREDYTNEYIRDINTIENNNELYEGLLSAVFGGLKMLFKKDWANIKCKNPSVLKHLQSIDKSLGGFTMTKMQFHGECNIIRQNIADYFNDILEYKLLQIEKAKDPDKFIEKENAEKEENKEAKESNKVARLLNLKDNTLLESLKKYKENISTACKASPKLREYADQMLNSVITFVNSIVISELENRGVDKEKLEDEKNRIEEETKKLEEERKELNDKNKKEEKEALKKISDERDDALKSLGIKPIGDMGGDKTIEVIKEQFNKVVENLNNKKLNESLLPEKYGKILNEDTYLGFKNSLEDINWEEEGKEDVNELYTILYIRVIANKINTAFDVLLENKGRFTDTASASVQAMMVSLVNAIIYGYVGEKFDIENNEHRLPLMTKCAIDSDATIGFNLPLVDEKKPDGGNFFVGIMYKFKSDIVSSKEVEDVVEKMAPEEIEKLYKDWKKE